MQNRHQENKKNNEKLIADQAKMEQDLQEMVKKMLTQGMTPKDAIGVSPSYLENMYSRAYQFYNTGKYTDASNLFRVLLIFNSMEPKYVMGLAASLHMMKDYVNSIQAYTICSVLDPSNPIPHFHSSDCFLQMKEYLSALICLELAIERSGERAEFAKMKERAQLTLENLKKEVAAHPVEKEPVSTRELNERPSVLYMTGPRTNLQR